VGRSVRIAEKTVNIHLFETPDEQGKGLQYLDAIDPDMLYVFPDVSEGVEFHSMNVPEPFDIAFLNEHYFVLSAHLMRPQADRIKAPTGTAMAVEAKAGNLGHWGFRPGRTMSPIE